MCKRLASFGVNTFAKILAIAPHLFDVDACKITIIGEEFVVGDVRSNLVDCRLLAPL